MGTLGAGIIKVLAFLFITSAVTLGLLQSSPFFSIPVQNASASYDCDDATLDMYRHFQNMGLEAVPVVGNLKLSGETYAQSNHVWLLVNTGDVKIAYDWGTPRFDRQHYEGYEISLDYLEYAARQDKKDPSLLMIAEK